MTAYCKTHSTWWALIFPSLLTLINLMSLSSSGWAQRKVYPVFKNINTSPSACEVSEAYGSAQRRAFQTLQEHANSNCLLFITFIKAWLRKVVFMGDCLEFIFSSRCYKFYAWIKPCLQKAIYQEISVFLVPHWSHPFYPIYVLVCWHVLFSKYMIRNS